MHSLKTRILSALCAAMLLLSLTACGGNSGSGDAGGSADAGSAAPAAMSKDEYVAQADSLSDAALAFTDAVTDFLGVWLANAEDMDAINAAIEEIRATKDPFVDFQSISNPAEGYEEAHAALAKDCGDFAALIEEYCGALLGAATGESDPSESDIETRMAETIESLSASIAAVDAVE